MRCYVFLQILVRNAQPSFSSEEMKMMFQVFRVLFHLHFTVKYFVFRVSAGYELYLLIGSPTVKL